MGSGMAEQEPFKRMPIYLKLRIDQRQIARLLAECANSPLPVEVTQLRIDPGKGKGSGNSSAAQQAAASSGAATMGNSSFDVPIEICGIIYMYNPPDASKVGTDEPTAGTPADADGTPAVAPGG